MDSRVLIEAWWELENAKGERYQEYDALGAPFGDGVPRRFSEVDRAPTRDIEGEVYEDTCELECIQHGSRFSLVTGEPHALPATRPVRVYEVRVVDGDVVVEV